VTPTRPPSFAFSELEITPLKTASCIPLTSTHGNNTIPAEEATAQLRRQHSGNLCQLHPPDFLFQSTFKMFATKVLRASAAVERVPMIKFIGKRTIPGKND
jgi:hypothetical protein